MGATVSAALLYGETVRLAGAQSATAGRFGVAVSGGADSMALLLLAAEAFPGRVEAATVDHGLREESAAEAEWVGRQCAELGIAHTSLHPVQPITGSIQASARAARYQLLEQWRQDRRIDWLMTAHHADDQLETMIMRLNRASGVGGLAGVRARQGHVLRPLLGVRHRDLITIVSTRNIVPINDPSNHDRRFDRVRVRERLQDQDVIDVASAAASAAHLADADAALDWVSRQLSTDRLIRDADSVALAATDVPAEIQRRLVLLALSELEPRRRPPRGATLDHALTLLLSGQPAMIGDVLITSGKDNIWRFSAASPRRQNV